MRNPEETKRRLLSAATTEFAALGIAGARVDQVAETAGCNKQSIYRYFGSKEGLFDAVYDQMVVQTISSVPMDAFDLPAYAGKLFDWYLAHPEVLRLAAWQQLEGRASGDAPSVAMQAGLDKVRLIKAAQQAGAVSKSIPAEHLLVLILRMSTAQLDYDRLHTSLRKTLRAAMIEAVRKLVATVPV